MNGINDNPICAIISFLLIIVVYEITRIKLNNRKMKLSLELYDVKYNGCSCGSKDLIFTGSITNDGSCKQSFEYKCLECGREYGNDTLYSFSDELDKEFSRSNMKNGGIIENTYDPSIIKD